MFRERPQLKLEKGMNVEPAGFVIGEEACISALVAFGVDHAGFDQKLRPTVIAVTGDQGVVQIEERQALREVSAAGFQSSSRCSQALRSGTVIGRLVASDWRSSATRVASSDGMSRRPCRSR